MYKVLSRFIPTDRVLVNEPMSRHTSFKIGGPALIYVQPSSQDELIKIVSECRNNGAPFIIVGRGTNILVSDEGVKKVVIQLHPNFGGCSLINERDLSRGNKVLMRADAGTLLSAAADAAINNSLTGLEFASGIPGTVGGAVVMNAGAYGHDISHVCESVDILTTDGGVKTLSKDEMRFAYRQSTVKQSKAIVLNAVFALSHGEKDKIAEYTKDLNKRRLNTQPLEYPSAGSVFKRPEGYYAGKLISDSGLKGFAIGGAQVSEKHAGFIINTGGATSQNVLDLIVHIQKTVNKKFGVRLETEIEYIS